MILLGMLLSFMAVLATPQPAFAATACSGDDNQTDAQRIFLEIDGTTNGTFDGTDYLDSDEDGCSEEGGNDISFDDYPAVIIHISCSENLVGTVFPTLGTVTDFWLNSVNNGGQTANSCQPLDDFPDPAEPSGSLVCDEVEPGQFSISYTLNKGDSAGPFNLTGPSGVTGLAGASTLTVVVSDAADGAYAISGTDAALTVPDDCSTLPPPDPDPVPVISLVKEAVVGEGSDLIGGGTNPLLQFSSSNPVSQTALYSYLITNTGDEPLVNIALSDDRIAAGDLDLSDCTENEPLAVGDSCTATGSEVFTFAQAEDVVGGTGLVTNTGTVTADGEESGDEVTDTDPATIAFSIVLSEANEKPNPAPDVENEIEELPAPEVESAAAELPAAGLDREGLLPLSLLLIAMGAAILWLDRPWVGVR